MDKTTVSNKELIYEFIVGFKMTHNGNSPNVREIAAGVGLTKQSNGTVNYHLSRLEREGRIVLTEGSKARMIEVPGYEWVKVSE